MRRARARHDRRGVRPEPLLEHRAVDAAVVDGRLEISVVVEPVPETGELADHRSAHPAPHQEADPRGAVVRAVGAVLLGPASELDQTRVRTRSARPRASRSRWKASSVARQLQALGRGVGLLRVRVVHAEGAQPDAVERQPRGEHRGEPGEPIRESALGLPDREPGFPNPLPVLNGSSCWRRRCAW